MQLKFRVWDDDNEVMEYFSFDDLDKVIEVLDSYNSYFSGDYFKGEGQKNIMQWIGKKDKTGKNIYQGDVLISSNTIDNDFDKWDKDEVGITVVLPFKDGLEVLYSDWAISNEASESVHGIDFIEVIGNIFENLEFLESGE